MSEQAALIGVVVVPLLGALAVMLAGSRPNLREAMSLAAAVILLALVVRLLPRALSGDGPRQSWQSQYPAYRWLSVLSHWECCSD